MSYRCGFCGTSTSPRKKKLTIVTETRSKTYHVNQGTHVGSEIVREVPACEPCFYTKKTAA